MGITDTDIFNHRQQMQRVIKLLEELVKQGNEITKLAEDVETIKKQLGLI